jgi:hypothetical protein
MSGSVCGGLFSSEIGPDLGARIWLTGSSNLSLTLDFDRLFRQACSMRQVHSADPAGMVIRCQGLPVVSRKSDANRSAVNWQQVVNSRDAECSLRGYVERKGTFDGWSIPCEVLQSR